MFNPTEKDIQELKKWGLFENPLAAAEDYSEAKAELRWENPYHRLSHEEYKKKREEETNNINFDNYYRTASKKIERHKWLYLKDRKAWYICPLNWDLFAKQDTTRILDLACGDGDVTQRVAEHIARVWKKDGYDGHEIEIVGMDVNKSRIENAKEHCLSPHNRIRLYFDVIDAVNDQVPFPDKYFDYALCTGVLEILADESANKMIKELCRLASKGIYIEDLADQYPGGFPRFNLDELFKNHNFHIKDHLWVLNAPFSKDKQMDPMKLWPILKIQVLFVIPDSTES